jgi:hypothetical protein
MLANREYEIWVNMPVPVPGTTLTDCYPSQYMTSYLQSAGAVTQAAFNPLICPGDYSAVGPYTSNYIACCPRYFLPPYLENISSTNSKTSGYSFAEPTVTALPLRPAFGGTCYSPIYEATPVIVTQYGNASVTATITFSATVTNAQAYALPYDGYAYGVAEVPSITSATTRTTSAIGTETLVVSSPNLKYRQFLTQTAPLRYCLLLIEHKLNLRFNKQHQYRCQSRHKRRSRRRRTRPPHSIYLVFPSESGEETNRWGGGCRKEITVE